LNFLKLNITCSKTMPTASRRNKKQAVQSSVGVNESSSVQSESVQSSPPARWERLVGRGSYGFVHKISEDKVMKVSFTEKSMDFGSCWREIDMLTKFKHPYVVNMTDVVFESPVVIPNKKEFRPEDKSMRMDNTYMLFEAGDFDLERGDLHKLGDVLKSIGQCLLAVEYLHNMNHIHRDIKPGNLVYFKKKGLTKLIDFGFCKPIYDGCTSNPESITPSYRPPDLFDTHQHQVLYGKETDVWSIAMTWIYLFSKKEPDLDEDCTNEQALEEIVSLIPSSLTDEEFSVRFPTIKKRPTWSTLLEEFNKMDGLRELLQQMLDYQPERRPTVTEVLNNKIFDFMREEIERTRDLIVPYPSYTLVMESSPERIIMVQQFNESDIVTKRMIFHAIDMVDRYIQYRIEHELPRPNPDISIMRARIIMYLSYKYFNILTKSCSISELFPKLHLSEAVKKEYEQWERIFVSQVLKYNIYRPTIYEMAYKNTNTLSKYIIQYKAASPELQNKLIAL
jgi:serine/threonine protein kinase